MSKFIEKLGSEDWLLADGATGTNLFDMGLNSGDAPELWNIKYPGRISDLYRAAVDAGSDTVSYTHLTLPTICSV